MRPRAPEGYGIVGRVSLAIPLKEFPVAPRLGGMLLEADRKGLLTPQGTDVQDGKAEQISLTIHLLHHRIILCLSEVPGFALK